MNQTVANRFFLLLVVVCTPLMVSGQLIIENTLTVEQYVQDILLGEGVSVSNITFNGAPANEINVQVGYFNSDNANVGISSGLILATGDVIGALGPNDTGGYSEIIPDGGMTGDLDLEQLNPGFDMNDIAVLEFDFIPNGDTLSFNYVFGSDEYLEFVNSSFNDAFGFFLCGPGISGPFSTPDNTIFPNGSANIALVPGTTQAVTIDNVNDASNSAYYVVNGEGFDEPFFSDESYIQYDGFTTPLEAFALVQCGETYHIKLAIADAGDTALDSGVFLQEGSFSSSMAIQTELQLNIGVSVNVLYENCGTGTLVFTRFGDLDESAVVELVTSGTAINGVDYTNIPNQVIFPPGDSIVTLEITAIADGIVEGIEDVAIDITNTVESACGVNVTSHFTFDIYDDPEALALDGGDYNNDCGDSVLIGSSVSGGYGQYSYSWYADGTLLPQYQDSVFYASPGITTEYTMEVEDICNAGTISATYLVTVPVYPELEVDINDEVELLCLEEVVMNINSYSGGNGEYTFAWYQEGQLLGTETSLDYIATGDTQLSVILTDGCGITTTDVMQVNVPPIPIIINLTEEQSICKGDVAVIVSEVSGGKPPYIYSWTSTAQDEDVITVSPLQSTVYELSIIDQCGATESASTSIEVSFVEAIFTAIELDYYGVEVQNHTQSDNAGDIVYRWDFGDGFTSSEFELSHMYTDLSDHFVTLTATTSMGCVDSTLHEIIAPKPIYIPNSFSPNGDGINDLFFVSGNNLEEFEISIFDRWGKILFHSKDITEKWNGKGADNERFYTMNSVYSYIINIRPNAGERESIKGSVTVIR